MTRSIFTITVDGKLIGKRTSDTRTYTHALLAAAADAAAVIRLEEAYVDRLTGELAILRAALEDPKVIIRDRGFRQGDLNLSGQPSYHNYMVTLKGSNDRVYSHSNSKGEVGGGWPIKADGNWDMEANYDGKIVTPAKAYLAASAQDKVRVIQEQVKGIQDRIQSLKSGDLSTLAPAHIISWHTSGPLAIKAQGSAAKTYPASRITVVPVDAK